MTDGIVAGYTTNLRKVGTPAVISDPHYHGCLVPLDRRRYPRWRMQALRAFLDSFHDNKAMDRHPS